MANTTRCDLPNCNINATFDLGAVKPVGEHPARYLCSRHALVHMHDVLNKDPRPHRTRVA